MIASFVRPVILLVLLLAPAAPVWSADLHPTQLEDAAPAGEGKGLFRFGVAYLEDSPLYFQTTSDDRTQISIPELELRLGLGKRVEISAGYSLLHVSQNNRRDEFGSGDLVLGTKLLLWPEDMKLPAIGLRFATKLPNADREDGRGTDETDVMLDVLASRNFPLFSLHANLGLTILGNPAGKQDDKLHYAFGVSVPFDNSGLSALAAVEGLELHNSVNDRGRFVAGLQYDFGQARFDFGVTTGYTSRTEDWGVRTGLTTTFDLPSGW
ncbi:MAG: hypothetical protein D6751_08570 [Deltaproteobacteria bacterium]|nr:MAG: hypothetical protein D6751_08570 [Deltaproteobacteria bacterium]